MAKYEDQTLEFDKILNLKNRFQSLSTEFTKKFDALRHYTDAVNDFYDQITKDIANVLLHKADSRLLA